ncbi:MAG: protein kinase [Acidobacteria bacterium]|nr:protein kinase [Acidobacteriota bacterium]
MKVETMTPDERYRREMEVFEQVLEAAAEDRPRLIGELCGEDNAIADRIRLLIAAHDEPTRIWQEMPGEALRGNIHAGTLLCDRFRLIRLLGKGGMGQVWEAADQAYSGDAKNVAVKLLGETLVSKPSAIARFKQEVQLARAIGHPNVCRVFELFEDSLSPPSRVFLTMELLAGETLAARLGKTERIRQAEAESIFRQILAGVSAAHDKRIVHRDLKPGNVMLTNSGSGVRAIVMDFGLAWTEDEGHVRGATTPSQTVLGTPDYMAPEQVAGTAVTPAADVYALGLIAFELFTGKVPLKGRTSGETTLLRAREDPPRLRSVAPEVSRQLESVVAKCLEFEPEKRYQNAGEILEAIGGALPSHFTGLIRLRLAWKPLLGVAAVLAAVAAFVLWKGGVSNIPAPAMRLYQRGLQSLSEGAVVKARSELGQAIGAAPAFAAAYAALAEVWLEMDSGNQARQAMLRASESAPDRSRLPRAEALYLEGMSRLVLNDCREALSSIEKMASATAELERPAALMTMARAAERCGQAGAAQQALDQVGRMEPANPAVLFRKALLATRQREYDKAMKWLAEAERLYRDGANMEGAGIVLLQRAVVQTNQNRLEDVRGTLEQALQLARTIGSVQLEIRVQLQQAIVHRMRGEMEAASAETARSLDLASRNGLETLALQGLFSAGNHHLAKLQTQQAEELYRKAAEIAIRDRDEANQARAQLSLASVYERTARLDQALEAIRTATPMLTRLGDTRNLATASALKGLVLFVKADYAASAEEFREMKRVAAARGDKDQELRAVEGEASALAALGEYPRAVQLYETALGSYMSAGRKARGFYTLANLSELQSKLGNVAAAEERLKQALAIAAEVEKAPGEFTSRTRMVTAANALRRGDYKLASKVAEVLLRGESHSVRRTEALTIVCLAKSRDRRPVVGVQCKQAIESAEKLGQFSLILAARLAMAEALLWAGNRIDAGEVTSAVEALLGKSAPTEDSWRVAAIRVAVEPTQTGKAQLLWKSLSQELERLRLQWGDSNYAGWRKRADVARMLANGPKERE